MPALIAGIHVFAAYIASKAWMGRGERAMTLMRLGARAKMRYPTRKLRCGSPACRSAITVSPAIAVCPSATNGRTPSGR
jgi:hypothetical protein